MERRFRKDIHQKALLLARFGKHPLPGAKIQRIADQMHDAGLDLRLGKHRVDGFRKSLQAI